MRITKTLISYLNFIKLGLSYFKGFSVHIDNELCYQHTGNSNPTNEFSIECSRTITGRYVNISNIRPGEIYHHFSLCEVEIYVCSRGTYGSECNNFCHCSNYDKCDVKTGQCPNGCQIGWDGDSCNTKCEGSYGENCNKQCSDRNCLDQSSCNNIDGKCIGECQAGYRSIDCTQPDERKLSSLESGVIGTVIGILVGFLIGVLVDRCWVTRLLAFKRR
ncbi:hypothetical protein LOTGIDRAFT_167232 [Lottia gigantea]|uniref:Fucolectin tachylectin-4 pentraxin-1 domain-containing protein n=1 Tax=Lottia gigantea TaxID=225164 RepID=V3Z6L7_LOTGI|nr:hypothetical protein LOTGIDRAFT_167232 [Lottia gigantea]ESO86418.1 hypothetical protein LOTGIDRAFT_167232 [Lottia gigantea]